MADPETPRIRQRAASGGKRYCVLCKRYENEIIEDGFKITLHRIPGGQSKPEISRKKAWIRTMKLHRPDLPLTDNTRVCILHFENKQYIRGESVPKFFNLNKNTEPRKVRRPLSEKFSNIQCETIENTDSLALDCIDVSVVGDEPDILLSETFIDHIDNCHTVEIENSSVLPECIVIDPRSVLTEHDYGTLESNPNVPVTTNAGSQTLPLPKSLMKPEDIENDDERTRFYTGYPNYATFLLIFQTLLSHGADKLTYWEGQKRSLGGENRTYNDDSVGKPGRKRRLRPLDEFYMVCVRLRLGLLQDHLKDVFGVSVMTVSRIMNTWINFMYDHMKSLIPWPTRDQIMSNLPKCFAEMPQVRIVVDATEFFCEKPSSLTAQNLTWSEYKHHNTFKVLVGVAPNGLVTFISRVWGGHTSDRHIVQKDGHLFIPRMEPGDIIQADKGFTVADLLPPHIGLNMPPFVSRSRQMTKSQFFKTQQIATSRIVVEMKMEQIKNFRALQTVLPLSEAHLAEQIIVICTAITNLYEPLLK